MPCVQVRWCGHKPCRRAGVQWFGYRCSFPSLSGAGIGLQPVYEQVSMRSEVQLAYVRGRQICAADQQPKLTVSVD